MSTSTRRAAENDRLGEEFLPRRVQLRVVGLAVGAQEGGRELVHERVDLTLGGWLT
jgi:hypothetical protein